MGSRPLIALGMASLALAACACARGAELNVFAAASLTDALQDIQAAYEKASGDRIFLNLGASSTLARQIQEGAPADLFLSADEEKMDALERRGLVLPGTRKSMLSNTLAIVVPADSALQIDSPEDLAGSGIRAIALAEPQTVPAGVYAREYLGRLKLWDKVAGKVIPTENVRAALAAVESGNVDAAVVYKTDAGIAKKVRIAFEVPRAEGPEISYPFAVLVESENQAAARRFLAWLESAPALEIFRKHGFLIQAR